VANVQSATGPNKLAGWALVMAVRASSLPPRNLTIFDGFKTVNSGSAGVTIPITGFKTPPSGPVRTTIGVVANEGDAGTAGDSMSLNGTRRSDANNPANNFFDSSISFSGVRFTDKAPNHLNQLGFDADLVDAPGLLPNGDQRDDRADHLGDTYLPGVVTFQTDLFAPNIQSDKTQENLDNPGGPYRPGDRIRFTIRLTNTGLDGASNFAVRDAIPTNASYVSGTLEQTAVATNTASCPAAFTGLTDGSGDNGAEFNTSDQRAMFRLGTGATATEAACCRPPRPARPARPNACASRRASTSTRPTGPQWTTRRSPPSSASRSAPR
jgi:uncharacterized repeat protein (TIGR01451 family)